MIVETTRFLAAVVLALIVVAPAIRVHVAAACPQPPPPCEALQEASIVMVAEVLEADNAKELLAPNPLPPAAVRLRVVERFKGVSEDQRELTARIWFDSNTVKLNAGRTFLVYANHLQGYPRDVWTTGCSRTKPLDDGRDEVRQLRKCVQR
jgi:hypothetical protein